MLEHLPERDRPPVKARLRKAWATEDYELALVNEFPDCYTCLKQMKNEADREWQQSRRDEADR